MAARLKTDVKLENLIDQLHQCVPALMVETGVPGLSLAVVHDAQVVWAQGFGVGDVDSQSPVTTDTLFEACSLSKAPFAYAALKLHERGLLDLDRPLITYLAECGIEDDPRLAMITMRNVLCHTCGLPNWRSDGEPLKLCLTPGERFSYSGEGYMFLQRVIERISGQSGEAFMQSELLQPLGMNQSTYLWSGESQLPLALGHDFAGKPVHKILNQEMWAASSLHCTATDFARFLAAMLQAGQVSASQLNPELVELMLTPHVQVNDSAPWQAGWPKETIILNPEIAWGLGWGIQLGNRPFSFWHWGDNVNYTAFAVGYRREGIGLVIMNNSGKGYGLFEQVCQTAIGGDYPALRWLHSLW